MPDLKIILNAQAPLTLAGAPNGFLPWLLADLARAAATRAMFIAADEAEMRGQTQPTDDGIVEAAPEVAHHQPELRDEPDGKK